MTDARGRWFRVYARQVKQHPKFRDLTAMELGAWTALRSECELRDGASLTDSADAILALRRRRVFRPKAVFARLVELRLFDVAKDGTVLVHDRDDHDRPKYPSDAPDKVTGRKRKSRDVTNRDDDSHDTHAGVQPQQAAPATAFSIQPQQASLPGEADSATAACRLFLNGGEWLGNREYTAAWDDMDRRYTSEWVLAEIQPAYATIMARHPRVKPWDLKRMVEFRCAERARIEGKQHEQALAEADRKETERLRELAESATEEERERASRMRRAVGLWIKQRPNEPVPANPGELQAWLERNEQGAA